MTHATRAPRRYAIAVIAALGTVLALVVALPVSAGAEDSPARAQNDWGAIALSIDGAYGKSYNYPTKKGALKRAKSECKKYSDYPGVCANVVYMVDGCAAVSVRFNSKGLVRGFTTAFGERRAPVVRAAQRKCVKRYGKKCVQRASVCTPSENG